MSGSQVVVTAVLVLGALIIGFVFGGLARVGQGPARSDSRPVPAPTLAAGTSPGEPRLRPPDTGGDLHPDHVTADGTIASASPTRAAGEPQASALLAVLDRYPIGIVVADADGEITFRNGVARSYDGTHVAALLDAAIDRRLAEVLNGVPTDDSECRATAGAGAAVELVEFYGPPRQVMSVRTERLADGAAVAFVDDVTESDRLDRVRTDFVANVSHELKTPIGALTLLAEALADETDEVVRERLIGRMEVEADRAGKTIDHLVELSEIESTPNHDPSPVAIPDLIDASVDRVRELARHRSVTIEVHTEDRVVGRAVIGHRVQLESALGNLVENAVAYSPPASSVTVAATLSAPAPTAPTPSSSEASAGDGEFVTLAVIDHGVGIPQDQRDRIFERFYRVDRARSRETGGTGLGLSIVKRAAIAHRGAVSVTSVEGEGSTFTLELPLAPRNASDSERPDDTGHPDHTDHTDHPDHTSRPGGLR